MSRFCFIILSFLSYTGQGFAQDQDPNVLRDSLKSENIDQRMEASWELFKYFRLSDRDSALVYAKLNNHLAKDADDNLALVKSYNALGFINRESGKFYNAIKFYKKALIIAEEYGLVTQEMYLLNNLGVIYSSYRDYESSLEYHLKSLRLRENLGDKFSIGITHSNIGLIYHRLGSYRRALCHFKKSVALKGYGKDDFDISFVNMAISYVNLEKYDSAQIIFKRLKEICKDGDCDSDGIEAIYSNTFYFYFNLEEFEKALIENEVSISLAKKRDSKLLLAEALLRKAEVFLKTKKYEKATDILVQVSHMQIDSKGLKANLDELYYKVFKGSGNFKLALQYYEKFVAVEDSLLNKESMQKMADLRTDYEVGQKQAEVDLLTAEKRTQQIIIYASIAGGVLSLIVLLLVIKNNREKRKINNILEDQKHKLESLNSTKDKFFSIISHDLRGPVSAFSGVSRLIKHAVQTKNHDELMDVADDIDQSVDHVAGLLDNLLNWAMQQQGHFPNVPEKLNIKLLAEEVQGIFTNMAESKGISLTVDMENDLTVWADQNSTMTILRNLVSNALKFTNKEGKVTIQGQSKGDTAQITIEDDGLGMSSPEVKNLFDLKGRKSAYGTAGEKGLGLGLQLVYEFVEMNNGTIKIESEERKGTRFIVKLPLFEPSHIHVYS